MRNGPVLTAAAVLALGIALAGWWIGDGFRKGREADRYVTVKGLSERDVEADVALWPLRYVAADNSLPAAQQAIDQSRATILKFLAKHGIEADDVQLQGLEVEDRQARMYGGGNDGGPRYSVQQVLMVRTDDPSEIRSASQAVGELVQAGVALSAGGGYGGGPTYLFTRLDDHKPAMIAEATASARQAAEKFAEDSGAHLGGILRANQGVFQILPRDQSPGISESQQPDKTLRIVSTIDYRLVD
jgi:hypothetical protein